LPSIRSQFMKVYSFHWPPTSGRQASRAGEKQQCACLTGENSTHLVGARFLFACRWGLIVRPKSIELVAVVPWELDRQA
jgi:hypothetical protein